MANEPDNNTQGTGTDPQTQNNQNDGNTGNAAEKKYSEEEMNGISKKNSEKAVKKFMKDLGITDVAAAKEILAKAAQSGDNGQPSGTNTAEVSELNTQLSKATERANLAVLENVLLKNHVKSDKVEKAAKLIDLADCLDDDGVFSREKADAAVKELLKDWEELVEKKAEGNTGFQIGSDGQSGSKNNTSGNKAVPSKRWNRFN